jgi:hypothetical protein
MTSRPSHNLQVSEVINALADTEPDLFGNGTATLMPVTYSDSATVVICDNTLGQTVGTKLDAISARLMKVARSHANAQVRYWRELGAYELPAGITQGIRS